MKSVVHDVIAKSEIFVFEDPNVSDVEVISI
jgi:hypothetical protein